jgi:hypothetical protein
LSNFARLAPQRQLNVLESRVQTCPSLHLGDEILDLWTQLSHHDLGGQQIRHQPAESLI